MLANEETILAVVLEDSSDTEKNDSEEWNAVFPDVYAWWMPHVCMPPEGCVARSTCSDKRNSRVLVTIMNMEETLLWPTRGST